MLEIADATFTNNYRINYLELPFGLGYHMPAGKSLGITIYLGGFYNIGIAGKNKVFVQSYLPALSPGYIESWETKHIKFETEDGMQDDFRKTNGGWQTGLSFSFLKKWNLEALYKHGISNLLTKEEGKYEERRLRLFSLGVKYDLFSHPIKKRSPGASLKKAF